VRTPFYIVGPTASGKSAVALALALRVGGEIVNADAYQLYRKLDVVSAKPSLSERQKVPHHLFDVLDPSEYCDAQRLRDLALPVIDRIANAGRTPIIVGGSGLYIKALTHGLANLPGRDPTLRHQLSQLTLEEMTAQLLSLDPDAPENVPMTNPRYVERALEICLLTGQPQSKLRQTFASIVPDAKGVVLSMERERLYERIRLRVLSMMAAGLIEEVRGMGELSITAEKAIGIRDVRRLLAGECTEAEAIEAITLATRRYAKRQNTWFRREQWLQTICLTEDSTPESTVNQILELFPELQE
jgi:tRNA dimethylallyltransferase